MITIDKHISRLIALHDCVIVPGFGAFLAQRIPAHYNAEEQTFMPPHRTLRFNPNITIDDALLATAYMQQYGISYNQAASLLKEDIKKLRNSLSRKGEICFGELGTMSMGIDGNVAFTASENGIDDPENYGLAPLHISVLSQKEEPTITIPISRKRIAQYIAAAAAIIIMFVFVTPLSEHTFKNSTKASFGDFASPEQISMMQQVSSPRPAVTANENCSITPIVNGQAAEAPAAEEKKAEETIETVEPVQKPAETAKEVEATAKSSAQQHHIIVASSPTIDNARLAVSELERKAAHNYTIVDCGKRYRISAGSFSTKEEAQAQLPAIQENFPDAWIYVQ